MTLDITVGDVEHNPTLTAAQHLALRKHTGRKSKSILTLSDEKNEPASQNERALSSV